MEFQEAERLYDKGRNLWDDGNYKAAVQVLRRAAQKTESQQNDRLVPTKRKEIQDVALEIWDWCAMAMHSAGQYEEAVACNNRNLSVRLGSSDYGPENEDTLETRRRLVENYSALGQHDNAIAECRNTLKIVDGSHDRNVLAQRLFQKGDERSIKEAVNINMYTLKRDEKKLGKSDFSLCKARYNLGVELCSLEKFEDAREFLQENFTILDVHAETNSRNKHARLRNDTWTALARCNQEIEVLKEIEERKAAQRAKKRAEQRREKGKLEKERAEKERAEKERAEKERTEKERAEKERAEKEREEEERAEKERIEKERAEKKQAEKKRAEKKRAEKERAEKEQAEKEREEEERAEKEQLEKQRLKKIHLEKERLKEERLEKERLEEEGQEKERLEKERRRNERQLQKARWEKEKLKISKPLEEQERLDEEKMEQERQKERDRLRKERKQKERKEKADRENEQKQDLVKKDEDTQDGLSLKRESPVIELGADLSSPESIHTTPSSKMKSRNDDMKTVGASKSSPKPSDKLQSKRERSPHVPSSKVSEQSIGKHKRKTSKSTQPALDQGELTHNRRASLSLTVKEPTSPKITKIKPVVEERKTSASKAPGTQDNQMKIPGSWPMTAEEDRYTIHTGLDVTSIVPEGQTSDIPRITYNGAGPPKVARKRHSNETLRSTVPGLLGPTQSLGRSLSVGHKKRPKSMDGNLFSTAGPNSAETRADLWFENLEDTAHKFLDWYAERKHEYQRKPNNSVKIAVLDTGVANSSRSGTPTTIRVSKSRITWCSVNGNSLNPRDDEDGHGTQVASILLKVTPYAKLYVYRIVRSKNDTIHPKLVAAALEDAVIKHNVDIVNMSFGWKHESGEGHEELRAALLKCHEKQVLVFAATSNNGLEYEPGMAYPARADGVIAIDAADSSGDWLDTNPSLDNEFKTHRFTALGQAIKTEEGWKRMDGTSAATPVAAGIAALILEFARQPPLCYAPEVQDLLKRPDAMREVLAGAVARKRNKLGEYRHLVPGTLFKVDPTTGKAGKWYHLGTSYRFDAVGSVGNILTTRYGRSIMEPMYEKIRQKWAEELAPKSVTRGLQDS